MFLRHMLKTPVWESRTGADALGCQRLACSLLGDTNSVTLTNWLLNVSSWNTASKKQCTFHVCMRVKKSEEMEVLIICYKDWALNSRLVCSHRGRDGARPESPMAATSGVRLWPRAEIGVVLQRVHTDCSAVAREQHHSGETPSSADQN